MKIDEDSLYSVKEVVKKNGGILPLGLSSVYAAIRSGKIPAVTLGKRKFISGATLKKLVSE
jgi:hypothetical protein